MSIKLSVLDQSPISEGSNASEAFQQTVTLAKKAEELGYTRFWVAEHHDSKMFAGSSPEILMAHLASVTTSIRIGSGGVMLPHYSAYKVAENFKVLEALFPGRIDAGIGRAPGGMPRSTYALHNGQYRDVHQFPEQVADLVMYLNDAVPDDHRYTGLQVTPLVDTVPPIWMLGSSPNSAILAAKKGLPYMFAQFINGEGGPTFAAQYREHFLPSTSLQKPKQAVAIFCVCGETDEEVERMVASLDYALIMRERGVEFDGVPSTEKALQYDYTPYEQQRAAENRHRMIIGTPKSVRTQIESLAKDYNADEVMLVMRTFDFQDKLKSYELIAKEMLQ